MPEGQAVQNMFATIAGRYDFANHLLSGGTDAYWRWRLRRRVVAQAPKDVVDLATGSGDVAFTLKRALGDDATVTGIDFCQPMLDEAIVKRDAKPSEKRLEVDFRWGDALDLDLPNDSVDALTIAFGLRNLEDRHRGLTEMRRVLRPGGRLHVLEFTQPVKFFRPLYYFYLKNFLPKLAGWATGRKDAYDYLAGSIESFPTKESLAEEIKAAGFGEVTATGLTLSIVALHEAVA